MKKIGNYKGIIICLSLIVLALFFPLTSRDYFWAKFNLGGLRDLINVANGNFFPSILAIVLSKSRILRAVFFGVIVYITAFLFKDNINKKNRVLSILSIFLFFLVDKSLFATSIVNLDNFTVQFVGSLVLLIFYNVFTKNDVYKYDNLILLILGYIGTMTTPSVMIVVFIMTLIYIFKGRHDKNDQKSYLLIGEMLGILTVVLTTHVEYSNIIDNLFKNFIPNLKGSNFLISFILGVLVIFEAAKMFLKSEKVKPALAIIGILFFLVTSIVSVPNTVYYVAFILNLASTYYILMNSNPSRAFKSHVANIYLFKILYIVATLIFNQIGSLLIFLVLTDIILILEIYNYKLPTNYLNWIWTIASIVLIMSNIYIYQKVYVKYEKMNFEIKNKLECSFWNLEVPKRYNSEYVYKIIPNTKEETEWYIDYYGIDPRKKDTSLILRIKE